MLCVAMLSVIMLSVVGPFRWNMIFTQKHDLKEAIDLLMNMINGTTHFKFFIYYRGHQLKGRLI